MDTDRSVRVAAERGDLPLLPTERLWGFKEFTFANSGLAIATWAFLIGGGTALFVGVRAGIAAIIIGNVIGVVITALATCLPTAKYGLEQFTFLRSMFGRHGSKLVFAISVIVLTMGWIAVLGLMFGRSIDGVLALTRGDEPDPQSLTVTLAAIVAIVLTGIIVARGPTSIKSFNMIVAPALVVMMFVMLGFIFAEHSLGSLLDMGAIDPPFEDERVNFMIAIEGNIAAGFSWWPYLGNLSRMVTDQRSAFWPNMLGIFGAAVVGEIVGLLAAISLGSSDPTLWMTQIGGTVVGVVALAFVAFANMTSMANIVYTSLVGLRQVTEDLLKRVSWDVLVALFLVIPLIIVLFFDDIYDGFFIFLVWTSAINSALAGIGVADYFFLRRQRLDIGSIFARSGGSMTFWRGVNPFALVSLMLGFVIYVVLFNPQTLENAGAFAFLSASVPSCLLAGGLHYLFTKTVVRRLGWGGYEVAAPTSAQRVES